MKTIKLFAVLLFFLMNTTAFAQQKNCSTYAQKIKEELLHPEYKAKRNVLQQKVQQWMTENKNYNMHGDSILIPVVVHVLWHESRENISDAQVLSQLKVLNEDFNGLNADTINTPGYYKKLRGKTNFYFVPARQDPDGIPTNGINRRYTIIDTGFGLDGRINFTALGGQDPWDPRFYVNIYVCQLAKSTNTFAVTYFPGGSLLREGIMCDYRFFGTAGTVRAPYNLGRTVTHEMGHYFNLDHTWGPSDLTALNICTDDDHVADTPPQSIANFGCPQYPHPSCIQDISDAFMDYMDYTDDACMNLFTQGQAERMVASYYVMTPYLKNSKALQQPVIAQNDAGIKTILLPENNSYTCADKITPKVVLRNYGTEVLQSVVINYTIDGTHIFSTQLTQLNLAPYAADTIKLTAINIPGGGSLSIIAFTASPNNKVDGNTQNDKATITFNSNKSDARPLPFTENFTAVKFPPAGWSVINHDHLFTWTPSTGSLLSGYAPSIIMDNIEFPKHGEKDELVTPPLDLSHATHPTLIFSHAFALYKFGKTKSDSLKVLVSKDCGESWSTVFYKGGRELSTAVNGRHGYFSPDSVSQWKKNIIDIAAFKGEPNVLISFQNIGGMENIVYIDNIAVKDMATAVSTIIVSNQQTVVKNICAGIQILPNPVAEHFILSGINANSVVQINCSNSVGQIVWKTDNINKNNLQLPQHLSNGIYFIQVIGDDKICTQKVVVQR